VDNVRCDNILTDTIKDSRDILTEIYLEMNFKIFSYALSIMRNRQLAEDITQDVFIKLKLNINKYKSSCNPTGWLLRITRNCCFNILKRQKYESVSDISDPNNKDFNKDFNDDEVIDNLLLKEAMEKLSFNERQIVMLYLVVGLTQKEIANLMRLPVTTINWKYRAALKKLQNLLI
jgi:RNA polymerase sigma-70 factor (ECF subfamily)